MKADTIFQVVLAAVLVGGLFPASEESTVAQSDRPRNAASRQPLPRNKPTLRVENLSPALERILKKWESATKDLPTLQGELKRYSYDKVFEIEKRAIGRFYYEAPDKGRIDILPDPKVKPGEVNEDKRRKDGSPYPVQKDSPERWVCTGAEIIQINDVDKTYVRFPIPPESRGVNIMDGPLPFLFGMPAEDAKRRYRFQLLNVPEKYKATRIWLRAKPRWPRDAQNYREALVSLDKKTYLPAEVKLTDPSGNIERVYTFRVGARKKSRIPGFSVLKIWASNPLRPDLNGYKLVKAPSPDGPVVPSLVGRKYHAAEETLQEIGYTVQPKRGPATADADLIWRVIRQDPPPNTPLGKGGQVVLLIYDIVRKP